MDRYLPNGICELNNIIVYCIGNISLIFFVWLVFKYIRYKIFNSDLTSFVGDHYGSILTK